jgi:myosin-crossreactive antigen
MTHDETKEAYERMVDGIITGLSEHGVPFETIKAVADVSVRVLAQEMAWLDAKPAKKAPKVEQPVLKLTAIEYQVVIEAWSITEETWADPAHRRNSKVPILHRAFRKVQAANTGPRP